MKRTLKIAAVVIGITALVAALWALVSYAGLQASLLWTAIIGAAAWAIRSSIEQKREHQKLLAERKQEHYLQFLQFLSKFMGPAGETDQKISNKAKQNQTPVPLDELRMWSLRLTLIGSDEVVREWNNARSASHDPNDSLFVLKNWGRLWLAMRRDCGHIDTQLGVTDVMAAFVNDVEKSRNYLDG